jgi:small subunit ribosomal protein S15
MSLAKEQKENIIQQYKVHDNDTGSPEVQVALISERLSELNSHFQTHKKDHHSRRGLLKLVGQRRKLLSYLKTIDKGRYEKLIKQLGLRK